MCIEKNIHEPPPTTLSVFAKRSYVHNSYDHRKTYNNNETVKSQVFT